MKKILLVLMSLLILLLTACSASVSDDSKKTSEASAAIVTQSATQKPAAAAEASKASEKATSSTSATATSSASDKASSPASSDSGVLGDYTVSITKFELIKDYKNKPAIRIYYDFTNNGTDTKSFLLAISAKAFQDGVQLGTAMVISKSVDEDANSIKDVKPGAHITCTELYSLSSTTSPVEVDASLLFSLDNNTKLTKTFDIASK